MRKKKLFFSNLIIATSLTLMACGNTNTASQPTETSSTTQQVTSTTAVTKTTSATKQTTTAQATTKQQSTTKSTGTTSKQTTTQATTKQQSTTKNTATTSSTENVAVQNDTEPQTPIATEPDTTKSAGGSVWIDDTGKKYHKKSTCSNMDAPYQVSVDEATARGYTPCKKCYK